MPKPHSRSKEEFIAAHEEFSKKCHQHLASEDGITKNPVIDGAIDPELYYDARFRIVWLLKEAYGEGGPRSDKPYYYNEILEENIWENFLKGHKSRNTWTPIAYISYSVLNNFWPYDGLDGIDENPAVGDAILHTAIVNTKKYPGSSTSNSFEIEAAYNKHRDLLLEQLKLLEPNIVIGGNTLEIYKNDLGFKEPAGYLKHYSDHPYYLKGGTLYIDTYHPGFRGGKEKYVDDCIELIKTWSESKI